MRKYKNKFLTKFINDSNLEVTCDLSFKKALNYKILLPAASTLIAEW